jgi:hypothetical protein
MCRVAQSLKLRRKQMRTRHQDGWVELRGGRVPKWYGHYYVYDINEQGKEVRKHRGTHLGDKAKMRKWEAEDKLRKIIVAASKNQPRSEHLTLTWFARERFLPMREPQWAPSTRETNLYGLDQHILPSLGNSPLTDLDKFKCQVFLNKLAQSGFSFTVVDHCRTMLKAILEEALDADLIGKNPARKLVNPETRIDQACSAKSAGSPTARFPSLPGSADGDDRGFLRNAAGGDIWTALVVVAR